MKVRLHQLNPTIGDIDGNTSGIKAAVRKAEAEGTELLLLPELAVCGYPPADLLERSSFREAAYRANSEIVKSTGEVTVIFGSVTENEDPYGRKCFNSALVANNGELISEVHKTLLPTYDVFDDLRYFEPNTEFSCIEIDGVSLGITICEDIWYNENDIQYHRYEVNPAKELADRGADAIINISASPFTKTKPGSRKEMLVKHATSLGLPIFYVNQVGANTELVFDGDSMALDAGGTVAGRSPLFEESFVDLEWEPVKGNLSTYEEHPVDVPSSLENMFRGLTCGVRDYLRKTGIADRVLLGLSGGIDSSLVACIAAEAVGPGNVLAVTMPSEFSSEGSVTDSEKLADQLGIELRHLSISDIYDEFIDTLDPFFKDTSFGIAEENLQSRIRGMLLMAVSNKFGHLLLNTGNKSELATGFCTLYGDMNGGLGVINDVYKTEVYEIARWLNETYYGKEVIPSAVIEKPPSAELRPEQRDSDTLPEYSVLDPILRLYIEKQYSLEKIVAEGFDRETVANVIKRVDYYEFKRFQSVPGLKMSTKAFGTGRRWPIVQQWTRNQVDS